MYNEAIPIHSLTIATQNLIEDGDFGFRIVLIGEWIYLMRKLAI